MMQVTARDAETVTQWMESPFDVWLQGGLRSAFGHAVTEPLPDDLVALVWNDVPDQDHLAR